MDFLDIYFRVVPRVESRREGDLRMCVYLYVTFRIISDRFGNISMGRGQGGGAAVLLVYGIAEEVRVLSRFSYADDV